MLQMPLKLFIPILKKDLLKLRLYPTIDYIQYSKGEVGARDNGKLKIEGKDYEVARRRCLTL